MVNQSYWLGQRGCEVVWCTFWRRVYNSLGKDRSNRSQVLHKKSYSKKLWKTNQGKKKLVLEFLFDKVADFSYILKILLKGNTTQVFSFIFSGQLSEKTFGDCSSETCSVWGKTEWWQKTSKGLIIVLYYQLPWITFMKILEKAYFTNENNFVNSYFLSGNKSVFVTFQVTWKDKKTTAMRKRKLYEFL